MRSPNYYSIVVRRLDGTILVKTEKFDSLMKKYPIFKKPFLRGISVLIDSLVLGIKTLIYSSDLYFVDEKHEVKELKTGSKLKLEIVGSLIVSFVFAILLFVLLPLGLTNLLKKSFLILQKNFGFALIDGVLRFIVFLLYVFFVSFFKDIKRVFQYHGAEHKAVFAYEDSAPLEVNFVKSYGNLHPRCGTNFIFIVMVLGILIIPIFPAATFLGKFLVRILALPLIASVSYECIRFFSEHKSNVICRMFLFPGLALQKLTTREPDEKQIEVAIKAMESVIKAEKEGQIENVSKI
jgi:uncharacterized protein YqhQ